MILLLILFGSFGFVALIAQTILVREFLVIFLGNELTLGIIFAAWLLGITLGATILAYLADRLKRLNLIFSLLVILLSVVLPAEIYLIRIARSFLEVPIGQPISFIPIVYLSLILTIPYSFLIGAIFPMACKVYTQCKSLDPAVQIGWVYIVEAVGSLLGGLIFTFLLVERFSPFQIALVNNILLLGLLFSYLRKTKLLAGQIISALLVIVNLIGLLVWVNKLDEFSIQARWKTFSHTELVKSIDSKYQNLGLGRLQDQFQLYGNGQLVTTFPDKRQYEPLAHLFLTEHPQPEDVLVIGGGAEGFLEPCLKHPIKSLHYIQLDPVLINLIADYLPQEDRQLLSLIPLKRDYLSSRTDPRLLIHHTDGRYFIKHTDQRFDLVVLNLPDPATAMMNRFYTQDFFRETKRVLKPGGVVVTGVSSAVNYFGETVMNYIGSVYDTLRSVFQYVLVTPGERAYLFATDQPKTITFDVNILAERYRARQVKSDYFISPASYEIMLEPDPIKFTEESLQKRTRHYLNTDFKPVSYFFNLILWDTLMRSGMGDPNPSVLFRFLMAVRFEWVIGTLLIILVLRFGLDKLFSIRAATRQRFNSLFAVFTIGFTTLSLELTLLLVFQNLHGYIYQKIGLIVSLFMAGLAAGGFIANRFIAKRTLNYIRGAMFINLIFIIFSLLLPYLFIPACAYLHADRWLAPLLTNEYPFMGLIIITGFLGGLVYPVANKMYLSAVPTAQAGLEAGACSEPFVYTERSECVPQGKLSESSVVGRSAGLIDSADHGGAALGALLTGVIFIPVFGIIQTCWISAALNILSLLFLASQRSSRAIRSGVYTSQ